MNTWGDGWNNLCFEWTFGRGSVVDIASTTHFHTSPRNDTDNLYSSHLPMSTDRYFSEHRHYLKQLIHKESRLLCAGRWLLSDLQVVMSNWSMYTVMVRLDRFILFLDLILRGQLIDVAASTAVTTQAAGRGVGAVPSIWAGLAWGASHCWTR